MKRDKILYWITTSIIAGLFVFSSYLYLSKAPFLVSTFKFLGFPEFFVTILGVAKLLGGIALLVPISNKVKEWAYAGFTFVLIGAAWTHIATHTPFIMPLIFLVVLALSYYFKKRISTGVAAKADFKPSFS
ncbi:DoxX family protein [Pinibacter aurantiacus]|uniref:DoxX family protein n=1 Tax=Pinibacter aurantiacus TaxID=2851599 RepID=A0A9E2S865_9BACT|nr:DoxX family protein [Pinibacter aurantiacus]MBV4356692.1 DoxX family protein [Pinibacter aurantiacus]